MKMMVVYGILIVLCIAAFGSYLIKNMPSRSAADGAKTAAQADEGTSPASSEDKSKAKSVLVKKAENPRFKNEEEKNRHVEELIKKAGGEPDPNPVVGIGRGEDYAKVTEEAIQNAGGLKDIVKKGDMVLIKPNLCTMALPDSARTTDYRAVQKVADMAWQCGASSVIVAEGNFYGNAFDEFNLKDSKYGSLTGVEFYNFNDAEKENCYELKPEKSLVGKGILVPKIFMDADVVINVAKMKTHFIPQAVVSLSLKNCFGIPPAKLYGGSGDKGGLHGLGMMEVILDLNRIRRPELNVIEGIVGGEGHGPVNNTPVKSNIMLAGKDPVALDTVGLSFMGFKVEDVPHVQRAGEEKIGISDLSKIKVNGADLNSIKMKFDR